MTSAIKEKLKIVLDLFVLDLYELSHQTERFERTGQIILDNERRIRKARETVGAFQELYSKYLGEYILLERQYLHSGLALDEVRQELTILFTQYQRDITDYLDILNSDAKRRLKEMRDRSIEIPAALVIQLESLSKVNLEQIKQA